MKQEPKNETAGPREGRKRLQTNPRILKTSARQRMEHLIGTASQKH